MIQDAVRTKIQDLIARSGPLLPRSEELRDSRHISLCQGWITEALNVVELAIPFPNNAYRRQIHKIGEGSGLILPKVGAISEMLRALLNDLDAGLIINLQNQIAAQAFDDFLDHAQTYYEKGRKSEAGVIAGV